MVEEEKKPKVSIASDSVIEKFKTKMHDIALAEEESEAKNIAGTSGIPYIDLRAFPVSQEALRIISKETALKEKVVCFLYDQENFRLGSPVADKNKAQFEEMIHQIAERHHAHGGLYFISEEGFQKVIKMYERLPVIKPITKGVTLTNDDLQKFAGQTKTLADFQALVQNISTTDLIAAIIGVALSFDASDVHVEAEATQVVIRFRLDGVLNDVAKIEKSEWERIISRIKLVSSLKLNIIDQPQDGRFTITRPDGEIDVRVSTLPTVFGESVVMRILKPVQKIGLKELGVDGKPLQILEEQMRRPNGMIITTGPTGSGKSTTLYAILRELNKPNIKIITLEDPVEYRMQGINQSQIDPSKDYTFANGLKALMRQDPDVAMVGEIRDLETAEVAIQASLTGHLILSTIHTNSSSGAIPRFLSMGVKPFLLAPALRASMGQRLVRKLCDNCKVVVALSAEQKEKITKAFGKVAPGVTAPDLNITKFYGPKGCEMCGNIGYKGRSGIYEIFSVTREIEDLILKGTTSASEIEDMAIVQGMIPMVQDGIFKAAQGITSIEEVLRVSE